MIRLFVAKEEEPSEQISMYQVAEFNAKIMEEGYASLS